MQIHRIDRLRLVLLINLFFIIATLVREALPWPVAVSFLCRFLNLMGKNNIASWWSGMLMFTGGLLALGRCHRLRIMSQRVIWGWALLAILMFLFSLDEIGSLHIRMEAGWLLKLGFGLLTLVSLLLLEDEFRVNRRSRWLLAGIAGFVLVVLLDLVTIGAPWHSRTALLLGVAEEGMELFAS